MDRTGKRGTARIAAAHLLVLGLAAGTLFGIHVVADAAAAHQAEAARMAGINAGQRLLSQRIASLAQSLALAEPDRRVTVEAALRDAVARMDNTHQSLVEGMTRSAGGLTASAAVRAIVLEPPLDLDAQIRRFIGTAQRFLTLPPSLQPGSAELAALLDDAFQPLPAALDAAAQQWERDGAAASGSARALLSVLLTGLLAVLAAEALFVVRPLFRRLAAVRAALQAAASTDPLTGCLNRRALMEAAGREFDRVRRYGGGVAMAVIAIDHFKAFNDTHGHAAGDEAIRALTATVAEAIRSTDIFGRFGGGEFFLILPETPLGDAQRVLDKLRLRVAENPVQAGTALVPMTVSIGLATVSGYDADVSGTINRAEQALHQAKSEGRNRVVTVMSTGTIPV